ncbi:MAG TPA: porin [Gammaproteobacteria bacterium]|nr:porin [Gammaproteobacteria bacterium]HQZ88010.1 porin [Gammaproteobacteria bacterium]
MKRKYSGITKTLVGGLVVLGMAASSNAFAVQARENKNKVTENANAENVTEGFDLGKGWLLNSTGGLSYTNENCSDYWFKLSGLLRFDEALFMGSYRDKGNNYPSGGNIRTADLYIEGGLAQDWTYNISLALNSSNRNMFGDTWISYAGFAENNQVYFGRVPGNWFGLDNANSGTWGPFLERSLVANTFYPGDGIGFMTDFWSDSAGITFTAMKSDQNSSNEVSNVRDRWKGTVRATVAPMHEEGDVWHFGVSGAYRELQNVVPTSASSVGALFQAFPGVKIRNNSATSLTSMINVVSTLTGNGGLPIQANNIRMFNLEAARQIGPFMLETEYTKAYVHRMGTQPFAGTTVQQGTLQFSGWNIQTRYLLTGEHHEYDVRDGQFGSVKPCSEHGAIEAAARYDFVDLNDKNVRGGSQHDVTLGLNWFLNQNVRLSMNYIRASIHPANDKAHRNLDIIGLRAQIRFK